MEPALLTKREGPVGWIIINRPEKRNAITLEMWYELQPFQEKRKPHFTGQ